MSDNTKIEWTDATWNIITGCSVVSAGCKNCYAMKLAGTRLQHHPSRAGLTVGTSNGPVWNGQVRFNREWLDQPLKWRRPRMIFVCAHGDLFHESVPDEWILEVFAVMAAAKQHTFQVLTKRAERMHALLIGKDLRWLIAGLQKLNKAGLIGPMAFSVEWPLPNVWLGVSIENQHVADMRIPFLLETPAAVRWISAEPLLGPVDITKWIDPDSFTGCADDGIKGLHWVVTGGESGPNARPMHPDWARSLRDQCNDAGAPFLFKQWGEWRPICQGAHDWYDDLYRSNRIARDHENQEALDDMYGRTCNVKSGMLHLDGLLYKVTDLNAFKAGTNAVQTFQVGKKASGRVLDDRTWDEYPKAGS